MSGQMVWCVACIEEGKEIVVHIFSSPEKANEFCASDPRMHVAYDYVIDCPERMEQPISRGAYAEAEAARLGRTRRVGA
jgi:hypothetical protein